MVILALALAGVAPVAGDRFDALKGTWSCSGHFVKSGRRLASRLDIRRDEGTHALIVRHDDIPPDSYRSLETWTMLADGSFRAAVASAGDMRIYRSSGWKGDTLTWSLADAGPSSEQFAYALTAANTMRVDWSIAANGAPMTLGDTLDCTRETH